MAAQAQDAVDRIGSSPPAPAPRAANAAEGAWSIALVDDGRAAWWNAYLDRAPDASLYHRYEWRGLVQRVFGKRGYYLAAEDGAGNCRGVLPLIHMKSPLFGNYMVSMPYFNYGGALGDAPDIVQGLVSRANALARELGCRHVELRHDRALPLELPVKTDKVTMVLALPDSVEALWAGFRPKLRAQIRRPEKSGAEGAIGGLELVPDFYQVFASNMRDLGTPVYSRRLFEAILSEFREARVAVVRMDGQPVAAGIVIGHRGRLEIPWASSLRSHNRHSPNMLLYGRLLEWAVLSGYREFDFGRCTRGSGTYRFKQQWGAQERPLYWHYWLRDGGALPELNPTNPTYARLVKVWQRLPVSLTKLAGPHIVKHLP